MNENEKAKVLMQDIDSDEQTQETAALTTTARYAHLARDSVRHATANVGGDLGPRLTPPASA